MYYRHRDMFGDSLGSGLVVVGLIVTLILVFCVVKLIVFVIRTFATYADTHKSLWITLAVFVASPIGAGVVYRVTGFDGAFALVGITLVVFLITCCVVSLKNRDTFMREHVNLVNEVLHRPWFGSEDTPLQEQEIGQVAA